MNIDQPTANIEQRTASADSATNRQTLPNNMVNLFDLLFILAKHWKMIVCVPIAAAIIAVIITLFMPNIYTAKTIIVSGDDDNAGIMGVVGLAALTGGLGSPNKVDLYITMLHCETIKDQIIDRFKLMDIYHAKFRSGVYLNLDKLVNVEKGKKDGVITITVDDADPKRAADMANAYVDELGKLAARLNMSGAGDNRVFLEKRIAEAHADLSRAEEALKEFQIKNKAISVTDQAKATIEGVAQLRAQLAIHEIQLATLQRQFTDSSQEVKTLKSTITNLRVQISRLEGIGGASSSIPSIGSIPQLGKEYLRLMRDFKIQEAMLEMLTKQYEVSKLSEAKDLSPFKVLQKAKVPERKSKPKRARICIMATLSTGFLIVLLAFLLEFDQWMLPEDRERWEGLKKLLPNFLRIPDFLRCVLPRRKV